MHYVEASGVTPAKVVISDKKPGVEGIAAYTVSRRYMHGLLVIVRDCRFDGMVAY
jgi:hypothetical protein